MSTDWAAFTTPRLWALVGVEDTPEAWAQVAAWDQIAGVVREQRGRLVRAREALAAAWPPERNRSAAAFLRHLDELVERMDEAYRDAGATAAGLGRILDALSAARGRIAPLQARYAEVSSDWVPAAWDHAEHELDRAARAAMAAAEEVVAAGAGELRVPPGYASPPGGGVALTSAPSAGAGDGREDVAVVRPPGSMPAPGAPAAGGGPPGSGVGLVAASVPRLRPGVVPLPGHAPEPPSLPGPTSGVGGGRSAGPGVSPSLGNGSPGRFGAGPPGGGGVAAPGGVSGGGGVAAPGGVPPGGGVAAPGGVPPGGAVAAPGGVSPGGGVAAPGGVSPGGGVAAPRGGVHSPGGGGEGPPGRIGVGSPLGGGAGPSTGGGVGPSTGGGVGTPVGGAVSAVNGHAAAAGHARRADPIGGPPRPTARPTGPSPPGDARAGGGHPKRPLVEEPASPSSSTGEPRRRQDYIWRTRTGVGAVIAAAMHRPRTHDPGPLLIGCRP